MAHEGKRHSFAGSGNTSIAALLKKNETNNENLFKLMRSEPSHINQINSATPDFNTVMKNYGTFSDKTWKRKVADEKARVDAFTSMSDDTSQTQLTDFDAKTKLKREKTAKNKAVIDERLGQYNFNNALFRDGIETGTEVGNQTKLVAEEKGSLVLNENSGIQTTASGQHLDPIGREINQLTTDVGQESYRQLNTDDVAFAAQKSIIEDVALEKAVLTEKAEHIDSHKYNRDRKGQIITDTPAHNQLHSEVTPTVEDYTITGTAQKAIIADEKLTKDTKDSALQSKQLGDSTELNADKAFIDDQSPFIYAVPNDENIEFGTATDLAVKSMDDISTQLQADFKAQIEEENLSATATSLAQESLSDKAKKDSTRLKEKEKKEESIFAHNKFQNDRIDSIANASDEAAKENRHAFDPENPPKAYGQILAEGSEQTTKAEREAYLKGLSERLEAEKNGGEAEARQAQLQKERMTEVLNRTENERTGGDFEGQRYANLNTGVDNLGQGVDERQRIADLPTGGSNLGQSQNERLNSQKKQESFEASKYNSSLGQQSQERLYRDENEKKARGAFRKLQAEKKAAKAKADAAVNASENAFQEDNGAVNVRSMMRGGASDPYHFTTLAYPPDAVNSQENGHFMLFYVNVQNKTKYEYNGYKNGNVVPVGGQVGTRIAATPAYEHLGDGTNYKAIPAKTVYTNDARESGLITDVEYQKQMIRNGGKGNIIYNNQKVLQKGRKSPGQNLASKYPTTTRITDSVALYLPSGIGNTTSVTYGDFETGIAGYAVMSGIDFGKSLQEEDFVGAATQLFDKSKTLIKDAVKNLTLKGLETLGGGEGLVQNFDKIFGQTLNPYIEVAFQSSGMRTFDYTFKFAPKSRAETDEVKAIINLFRFHMLPEMKGTSSRYLTLPSTFDIHYMWQSGRTTAKENSFYNKIATCVLTNVDVNYTPNGEVQSFGDGAPTETSMRLSFKETEMMTKQHVNEGF